MIPRRLHPRPRRSAAAVLSAAFLALLPVGEACAGTIGFRTDAAVEVGAGVDVKVTLTHTGDEVAENVLVRVEMLDRAMNGVAVPALGPNQTQSWNFHLFDDLAPGVYAIVIRTSYADTNGYPFEVISTAGATVGVTPGPRIFGGFSVPRVEVGGRATGRFTAKRPPGRNGPAELELVSPEGLDLRPSTAALVFDEGGRATVEFEVRNRKLLAGTAVNVFALVRANDPGFPQVDSVRGTVRIAAATPRVRTPMFYQVAAGILALLALLEIGARVLDRRKAAA